MKGFVLKFVLPVALFLFVISDLSKSDESVIKEIIQPYHGEIEITSQVDGLNLTIDEKVLGVLKKGEVFKYKFKNEDGSGDFGWHEIILQKDIDEEKEYYLLTESYVSEDELKKKEIEKIEVMPPEYDWRKQKAYNEFAKRIEVRYKRDVLLKKTGLIKEVKLQHNGSYHMAYDEKNIYILSRASSTMYKKSQQEKVDGEFLEVYDLETLQLQHHEKIGQSKDTFGLTTSIGVNDRLVYVGTYIPNVIYIDKKNIKKTKPRKVLQSIGHAGKINAIKNYKEYTFVLDEGGNVSVYKNSQYLYSLKTEFYTSKRYQKLEDKKFGSVFDLLVHKGIIYISNDIGTIYKFRLNDKKAEFVGGFETYEYDKEKDSYHADDIPDMLMYKDRYLLFSREYKGLSMYDTKLNKMVYEKKNLYPKDVRYSELFKEEVDLTKSTNIDRMLIYKDNLIFSEVDEEIVVYSFSKQMIIHKFRGVSADVFDIMVYKDRLISLGSDGKLYVWDLNILKQYEGDMDALKKMIKNIGK